MLKILKTFPFLSSWLSPFSLRNAAIVTLSDGCTLRIVMKWQITFRCILMCVMSYTCVCKVLSNVSRVKEASVAKRSRVSDLGYRIYICCISIYIQGYFIKVQQCFIMVSNQKISENNVSMYINKYEILKWIACWRNRNQVKVRMLCYYTTSNVCSFSGKVLLANNNFWNILIS